MTCMVRVNFSRYGGMAVIEPERVFVFPSAPGATRSVLGFGALPAPTRADVERAARRGRLHPDPMVATSSVEWARRCRARSLSLSKLALSAVGAAASAGLLGDAPEVEGLKAWWHDRRLAKRILAAAGRCEIPAPTWSIPSTPAVPSRACRPTVGLSARGRERRPG